jgi:GAF domain-containing protein
LIKRDINAASLCICVAQVYERFLLSRSLERSQRQNLIIADIALRIHQFSDLTDVLKTLVHEVRCFLGADRVLVYKFSPDLSGTIIAESVVPPWSASLNNQIEDTCFQANGVGHYLQGKAIILPDIETANLTDCYRELLEGFQVRASLIDPIFLSNETVQPLWGLLVVHQCSRPRSWDNNDIHLVQHLSVQISLAIQQTEFYRSQQLLNASLVREQETAESANRAKREFLAFMSHEIDAPMRNVLDLSQSALQGDLTDQQRDRLNQIHQLTQSVLHITDEMLNRSEQDSEST